MGCQFVAGGRLVPSLVGVALNNRYFHIDIMKVMMYIYRSSSGVCLMKRDLTQGNITGNLVGMAVPIMLGFMAQTLYELVDMAWVGQLSASAVAAVTVFSTIYYLSFVLNNVVGNASVSLISQSFGAKDHERAKRVIEQTLVFKALLAVIASLLILPLLPRLLGLFTDDPAVLGEALAYGRIRLLMLPIMFSSLTVATALRCIGDSKRAMQIMFVSAGLNVILDPILIFERVPLLGIPGLGLGIFGAALATEIAAAAALLFGGWILFTGKSEVQPRWKGLLRLDWEIDWQLLKVGMPQSVESLLRSVADVFIMRLVSSFGTIALAAMGIVQRLAGFLFVPLNGLMSAGSTIVGQNLGAQKVERAEQTAKAAAWLGLGSMTAFALIVALLQSQIFRIFTNDPAVAAMGRSAMFALLPMLIIAGFVFGLATALAGAGYNLPFLISGVVARWGVQLPFLLVTVQLMQLPFFYAALSFTVSELAGGVVIVVAYMRGRWRTWRVIETSEEQQTEATTA